MQFRLCDWCKHEERKAGLFLNDHLYRNHDRDCVTCLVSWRESCDSEQDGSGRSFAITQQNAIFFRFAQNALVWCKHFFSEQPEQQFDKRSVKHFGEQQLRQSVECQSERIRKRGFDPAPTCHVLGSSREFNDCSECPGRTLGTEIRPTQKRFLARLYAHLTTDSGIDGDSSIGADFDADSESDSGGDSE